MGEVAGLCMTKDEADIIGPVIEHMLGEVDFIVIADNGSTDGTREILNRFVNLGAPITVLDDEEVGYHHGATITALAQAAGDEGAEWVVPFDSDEIHYSPFGTLKEVLNKLGPQWLVASAELYDHVATGADSDDANPVRRMGWRRRNPSTLPKVACRVRPDLVVADGNHSAHYDGGATIHPGLLVVRHFPYRTGEQMARKARNGAEAMKASNLPEDTCAHWRQYGALMDARGPEALHAVFREHFWTPNPQARRDLIFDPAPV